MSKFNELVGSYNIRPANEIKFKASIVKEVISSILSDELISKEYNSALADGWAHEIASTLGQRLPELGFERYKFIAHVVIGEQRGAGIKISSKGLIDCDTDSCATASFSSASLYCTATVFGVYHY